MNGLQYPNALHFCVTRPQTAAGFPGRWDEALSAAVDHARRAEGDPASAAIYGGVPESMPSMREMIAEFMRGFLDVTQSVPEG